MSESVLLYCTVYPALQVAQKPFGVIRHCPGPVSSRKGGGWLVGLAGSLFLKGPKLPTLKSALNLYSKTTFLIIFSSCPVNTAPWPRGTGPGLRDCVSFSISFFILQFCSLFPYSKHCWQVLFGCEFYNSIRCNIASNWNHMHRTSPFLLYSV